MRLFSDLRQDLCYGLRALRGSPGFTAVAVVSLTLGIAVATSAFSELNGFVLRDVPGIARPDELELLEAPAAWPDYRRYAARTDLFSGAMAYAAPVPLAVTLGGRTERVWGHLVSGSYFATLGVRPLLGRVFDAGDDRPGRAPGVVVSYGFWQRAVGGDRAAIGRALRINGYPCVVVGIAPADFQGASPMIYAADLWLAAGQIAPLGMAPELSGDALEHHDRAIFHVVARLRPGVPPARAEAALDTVARQLEREYADPNRDQKGRRVVFLPGGKMLPVPKRDIPFLTGFYTLLGGMILLIASANVANMLLARAAGRRREIAMRLALGAGRGRLIRQLLTESMLVAGGAGVLGLLLAEWLMGLASQAKIPWPMPLHFHLEPDARVVLFSIGLTLFTGLAFGLVPALQATRGDLVPALKEGGDVRLHRFRRLSLRNLLVVAQVAGSLALLQMTGFLVVAQQKMTGIETGFDARHLSLLSLDPIRDGYSGERAAAFFRKLHDRLKTDPAILAASYADSVPMTMIGKPSVTFSVPGPGGSKVLHSARRYVVAREFFDTMGIPILRGRGFREEDEGAGSSAAIVSEKLVRDCWKGEDPLGRRMEIGDEDLPTFAVPGGPSGRLPGTKGKTRMVEVVGVVKNIRNGLDVVPADAPAVIYLPLTDADYARPGLRGVSLLLRGAPGVDVLAAARREISAMDPKLTPFNARSMVEQIEEMMSPVHVAVWIYGLIGIFGLILASVGLAGVTAYSVAQRRREIGLRVALGARGSDVLGLVMKEGAAMVACGTAIGLAVAASGIRGLAAIFSQIAKAGGTTASDPLLVAGAPLLLAGVALAACYFPARQATRIDPAVTLRDAG